MILYEITPDSELAGCDAALRFIKDDEQAVLSLNQGGILKWLAVTDPYAIAADLPDSHFHVLTNPMKVFRCYPKTAA